MKMKFITMLMLPVAAFTLASAAAISTDNSKESKTSTLMTAYIHNPSVFDCAEVTVDCQVGSGPTCLYNNTWEAFDKESETSCNIQLERVQ